MVFQATFMYKAVYNIKNQSNWNIWHNIIDKNKNF